MTVGIGTLDDNGTTQTRTHNAANEIGTISTWHNPTFDAAGNMASGPKPGDGSPVGGAEQEYTYDAWNRLVKVRKRQYSGGTPGAWVEVAYYRYDGLHRRIRKFTFTGTADTFDVHDYYYSRQWQVLEACTEENVSWDPDANPVVEPSVATDVTEQNLWDARYVDALAVRWHDKNTDGDFDTDEEYYFAQDANFNVTALVNGSGAVLERYEYDAYGAVRFLDASFNLKLDGGNPKTKSDYNNPYLYTGRRLDTDTGLYHYRHRDYDPYLARFTARDKIGYAAGDMNLYAYVGGGPVKLLDPWGTQALDPAFMSKPDYDGIIRTIQKNNPSDTDGTREDKCCVTIAVIVEVPDDTRIGHTGIGIGKPGEGFQPSRMEFYDFGPHLGKSLRDARPVKGSPYWDIRARQHSPNTGQLVKDAKFSDILHNLDGLSKGKETWLFVTQVTSKQGGNIEKYWRKTMYNIDPTTGQRGEMPKYSFADTPLAENCTSSVANSLRDAGNPWLFGTPVGANVTEFIKIEPIVPDAFRNQLLGLPPYPGQQLRKTCGPNKGKRADVYTRHTKNGAASWSVYIPQK